MDFRQLVVNNFISMYSVYVDNISNLLTFVYWYEKREIKSIVFIVAQQEDDKEKKF